MQDIEELRGQKLNDVTQMMDETHQKYIVVREYEHEMEGSDELVVAAIKDGDRVKLITGKFKFLTKNN